MTKTWSLLLPYRRPPLSLNRRLHHMVEYRLKAEMKQAAIVLAKANRLPAMKAVTAELIWCKGDNRTADSDNISPNLKPLLDGLVAAGVLPEDNANHVLRTSTRIVLRRDDNYPNHGPRLYLTIRDLSALAVTND